VVYTYRIFYNDMDVDVYMGMNEFIYGWLQIFMLLAIWGIE